MSMAAPNGTTWGSEVNAKGRIGLYVTSSSTDTQTTVTIEVWFWSRYSCLDNSNTLYFNDGSTTATTSRGKVSINTTVNNSWNTANQVKIGTYTYHYARVSENNTVYCAAKLANIDYVGAVMTVYTSYTVPALARYTISYNANGGSGAPSAQTKIFGTNISLSAGIPTRTGYTFKGWATSAGGGVAYAPGSNYTANATVTLYAVWQINTYTVSYNANGGSGAPASQTKTYGVALTLASTKPTRTNYNFLGWGTSASATTAAYAAGESYTANAAIILYAVWELAYSEPTISNISAARCTSNGTTDDTGTYVKIAFSWSCDQTQGSNTISSITIRYKVSTATSWISVTVNASGTSGNVSQIIGDGGISVNNVYTIEISVTDSMNGTTTVTRTVAGTAFPIDFLKGGKGVAFGQPASRKNAVDFGWVLFDRFGDRINNGLVKYKESDGITHIDPNTTILHEILTHHDNCPNTSWHFYITTQFFSAKGTTNNCVQYAFPYGETGSSKSMYYRRRLSGTWTAWFTIPSIDEIYPVNSIYISYSHVSPASLFGGTWSRIENCFLWGCDSTGGIGDTGGEKTHVLTASEMPSHEHEVRVGTATGMGGGVNYITPAQVSQPTGGRNSIMSVAAGSGGAHNNMPPYVQVSIWRRTA